MTNPNDLSPKQKHCPDDCLFLSSRQFMPEFLPYYCDKYEEFLGAMPSKKPKRCYGCRGCAFNVRRAGVSLIAAYTQEYISIEETQRAFLQMGRGFCRMFVELLRKVGRQIGLSGAHSAGLDELSEKMLVAWTGAQKHAGSPDLKGFKAVMAGVLDSSPDLLSKQTQNLLENLFGVLDKSERAMLKSVLANANQIEAFLQEFSHLPKDMNLLKNFRGLLYEYDAKENQRQEMERQQMKRLQYERFLAQQSQRGRG